MSINRFGRNLKRFRLISFDVTDTLLKFSTPPALQYLKTATSFGYNVNIDQNKLNSLFKNEYKKMYKKYPNYGKNINGMTFIDWWRLLVIKVFEKSNSDIPENDIKRIADKLIELYKTEECWKEIDGATEIINKIKNENKLLGIISNTDPRLHDVIKCIKLPKFDFIYTSYELGYTKPDRRIYDKVLKIHKIVNANEALHIGNTLICDYLGARNAGWSAIHISNYSEEWKNDPQVNEKHVFNSMKCFLNEMEKSNIEW